MCLCVAVRWFWWLLGGGWVPWPCQLVHVRAVMYSARCHVALDGSVYTYSWRAVAAVWFLPEASLG